MNAKTMLALGCAALLACASPREDAVPASIDRAKVPHQTVEMTARKFEFTPSTVRIAAGTLVTVEVESTQGTHGFAIDRFGIDEPLDEGVKKTVVFFAATPGEIAFRCSHWCGMGHLSMNGKFIVE